MKIHYLTATIVLFLAGCGKSGTGGYGTTQTDTSSSAETRSPTAAQYTDTNAPIPSGKNTDVSSGLGTAGITGTESSRTSSDSNTPGRSSQSPGDITTPNSDYQPGSLDKALSSKVKTSLRITDGSGKPLNLDNIQVSVIKGVVTLKGTVRSDAEKQIVEGEVQKLDGVTMVKNELRVSSDASAQGSATAPDQSGTSSSKKD